MTLEELKAKIKKEFEEKFSPYRDPLKGFREGVILHEKDFVAASAFLDKAIEESVREAFKAVDGCCSCLDEPSRPCLDALCGQGLDEFDTKKDNFLNN